MTRLVLIRSSMRSLIPMAEKVEAVASREKDGRPIKEVVDAAYTKAGYKPPLKSAIAYANFRKAIQNAIDAGDEKVIGLCKEFDLLQAVEESENTPPAEETEETPSARRGRPRKASF